METHDRPHIVLIVLEDSGLLLGCSGDPVARTPNLDALAARGCRWMNLFSTAPVCAPARSSLITGRYPQRVGTHHMRSTLRKSPPLFTQRLREAGYFVSWPTKTDFNLDPATADGVAWRDDDQRWEQRLATGTLNDRPTFLYINFNGTHESGMWSMPGPDDRPGPAGWTGDGRPLVPDPRDVPVPPYLPDTPEVRTDIARHYRNLEYVDAQVGGVLEALEASGRADSTCVMVIADHGRGLAREKRWCYPAGLRVPMITAGPGIEAGTIRHKPVSMVDIPATILDLAGAGPMGDGRSVFAGEPRTLAFFGRDRMDEAYDCVRGCTDGRWFYLRNDFPDIARGQRNQYMEYMATTQVMRRMLAEGALESPADVWFRLRTAEELYDLDADPHAVRNLADDPAHTAKLAELSAAVEGWRDDTGDLGRVPERELVRRGLVDDRLTEYAEKLAALPPDRQPPGRCGLIERPTT
ncbi:MAG: sulfatase [Planctomycetota bacterium]